VRPCDLLANATAEVWFNLRSTAKRARPPPQIKKFQRGCNRLKPVALSASSGQKALHLWSNGEMLKSVFSALKLKPQIKKEINADPRGCANS
jgi:hypothetical protein